MFIYIFSYLFMYVLIDWFSYLIIYLFIYIFIYLCVYLFIYLSIYLLEGEGGLYLILLNFIFSSGKAVEKMKSLVLKEKISLYLNWKSMNFFSFFLKRTALFLMKYIQYETNGRLFSPAGGVTTHRSWRKQPFLKICNQSNTLFLRASHFKL